MAFLCQSGWRARDPPGGGRRRIFARGDGISCRRSAAGDLPPRISTSIPPNDRAALVLREVGARRKVALAAATSVRCPPFNRSSRHGAHCFEGVRHRRQLSTTSALRWNRRNLRAGWETIPPIERAMFLPAVRNDAVCRPNHRVLQDFATATSAPHCVSCTDVPPNRGRWIPWRAKWVFHVRCSQNASAS